MTLIYLLLYAILSHDQIFFEGMENCHSHCKIIVDLLNLGDTWHVGENRRRLFPIDYFKRSHVSDNMVRSVVPVGPWLWKQEKIKEEKGECELRGIHSDCYWVEVSKREENTERSKSLNEEIEDDRSERKKDCGQLSKWKNPPLYALEHRARRKERQAGEALKIRVKST
jgi:hypothetical protein